MAVTDWNWTPISLPALNNVRSTGEAQPLPPELWPVWMQNAPAFVGAWFTPLDQRRSGSSGNLSTGHAQAEVPRSASAGGSTHRYYRFFYCELTDGRVFRRDRRRTSASVTISMCAPRGSPRTDRPRPTSRMRLSGGSKGKTWRARPTDGFGDGWSDQRGGRDTDRVIRGYEEQRGLYRTEYAKGYRGRSRLQAAPRALRCAREEVA